MTDITIAIDINNTELLYLGLVRVKSFATHYKSVTGLVTKRVSLKI